MNIQIKKATIEDLDAVLKLNKQLFTFETKFDKTYNQEWTYSDRGQIFFKKRIESGIVLLAEIDKEIAGYLCGYTDNYSVRSLNPIFEIENMFVVKNFQQQGIGTILIQELEKILRLNSVRIIKVGAIFKNSNAINFYQKNNFSAHEIYLEKQL